MQITINGASYEVTEDESLFDLPSGEVELTTDAPVAFWCAGKDPSVRRGDYRTELNRIHKGTPIPLGAIPEGWKLAVSLRADLPALHVRPPRPPAPPPLPGPTEEELARRADARQDREFERHVIDVMKARYLAEFDEPQPSPVAPPVEAEAEPYAPDFTMIPEGLAKYAEADESAEDFRRRAFSLLFRFGINEGEHFEGAGPLTPEEKITLLPMLIANFKSGNWLNLSEDLLQN